MTEFQKSDADTQRKIRDVADLLVREGSQYRNQQLIQDVSPLGMMKLPNRLGMWLGLVAISCGALVFFLKEDSKSTVETRVPVQLEDEVVPNAEDDALGLENSEQLDVGETDRGPIDGGDNGLDQNDGTLNGGTQNGGVFFDIGDVELEPTPGTLNGVNDATDLPAIVEPPTFPELTTPTTSIPDEFAQVGPRITDVTVPAVVQAGSSLTFRWRVAAPARVSATGVRVGWASGIFSSCGFGDTGTLENGTTRDGEWSYTCWIPSNAVSTVYSVSIWVSDLLGVTSDISETTFVVEGGSDDSSAPLYTNVSVENNVSPGGTVVIKWILSDQSGIEGAVMWVAGPTGFYNLASEKSYANYATLEITRDCNSAGDKCELTQSVQIDPTSPAGVYTLWVSATDKLGNKVLEPSIQFDVTN
jgi:hypothetical protein